MGGQSKSQIVGYKYSLYAHFIFGAGVADFVSKIWFRDIDTIAWQGKQEVNGIININKPELFGGQSSQGGVVGNIAFMNGAVDQMPNAYQVGFRGELTPAYRAVMGVIWQDLNIGMNPYLPTWGLEWSRIHKRISLDGISDRVQWYDEKSAIPTANSFAISEMFTEEHWDYNWYSSTAEEALSDANKELEINLTGWTVDQEKINVPFESDTVNWPINDGENNQTVMWYRWNFTPKSSQDINIRFSALFPSSMWINGNFIGVFDGLFQDILIPKSKIKYGENNVIAIRAIGSDQTLHYVYSHHENLPNVQIPDYGHYPLDEYIANTPVEHGVLGTAFEHHFRNAYPDGDPHLDLEYIPDLEGHLTDENGIQYWTNLYCYSSNTLVTYGGSVSRYLVGEENNVLIFDASTIQTFDMNPIHIMREFKTEPWSSARIDESLLPDDVWQDAADTVYNEGLGMTFMYDGSQSIEGAMAEVCRHIGAETYSDRRTGEFKVKLIRNDYDVETIPSFDESNIIDMSKDDTPVFGQLTTDVVVNYTDTENSFVEASITVQDIALAQQQGKRITANLDYKGFTSGEVAGRKAQQMLNTLSKPLQKRRFVVRTSAGKDLNKGDVFKFSWDCENIVDMVMRVTDLNFGNGISNRIMIDAVQDEFAMPATSFIAPPASDWTPPYSEPTSLNDRMVIEAPYLELVQLQGQSAVDSQLSDAPESAYVLTVAPVQNNAIKAMIYDGISDYSQVGILELCPVATLDQDIDFEEYSFAFTNVKNISEIEVGTWCQIGDEILRVDSISDSSAVMGRGCLDTIPKLHYTGDKIYFWDNAALTDSTEFITGSEVNVKMLTINSKGQLALDDAPVDTVTMVGRAARPYPPANVQVDGSYYPLSVDEEFIVTWVNRNRVQQTSGTIADWYDGNITPAVNTRYTLLFKDSTDTLLVQEDNIGLPTATVALGVTDNITMELWTVDDVGQSMMTFTHTFAYTPEVGVTTNTITATSYTPVDTTTIIDGGQI